MFFNFDILYKNGPLALIWKAGSLKVIKNRRDALFRKLLDVDLNEAFELLRRELPRMGTAHGLPLSKAMVIVRGLETIYYYKIDFLAKSVVEVHFNIRTAVENARRLQEIDLPPPPKKRAKKGTGAGDGDGEGGDRNEFNVTVTHADEVQAAFGFLEMDYVNMMEIPDSQPRRFANNEEDDIARDMGSGRSGRSSPGPSDAARSRRRATKRRPAVEGQDVMNLLQESIRSRRGDPNLIKEVPDLRHRAEPVEFEGFGFGDFNMNEDEETGQPPQVSDLLLHPNLGSPPGRATTDPPYGARTRDPRVPAPEEQPEPMDMGYDFPEFEPPVIIPPSPSPRSFVLPPLDASFAQRGRGRRARRKLIVDESHTMTMEELRRQCAKQRLTPGSVKENLITEIRIKGHKMMESKNFFGNVGRLGFRFPRAGRISGLGGTAIMEFVRNQIGQQDKLRLKGLREEIADQDAEQNQPFPVELEYAGAELTDQEGVGAEGLRQTTGVSAQGSRLPQPPGNMTGGTLFPEPNPDEMMPPAPDFGFGFEEQPEMAVSDVDFNIPRPEGDDMQQRESPIESLQNGERVKFADLYPPRSTSKRTAASAFFQLLNLHKLQHVELEQEGLFTDLWIKRLN